MVETLLGGGVFRLERIVSHGHASPEGFWYDQAEHEWVVVLAGAARLRFEGEEPLELGAGSCVNVPARRRHRVEIGPIRAVRRCGWQSSTASRRVHDEPARGGAGATRDRPRSSRPAQVKPFLIGAAERGRR